MFHRRPTATGRASVCVPRGTRFERPRRHPARGAVPSSKAQTLAATASGVRQACRWRPLATLTKRLALPREQFVQLRETCRVIEASECALSS